MTEFNNRINGHYLGRLSRALSVSAAFLGLIALIGWVLSVKWLTSFWPDGIPMAPTTALLFVLYGTALPLRTTLADNNGNSHLSTFLAWTGFGLSIAFLVLSLVRVYLPVEYLGMNISGTVQGAPVGHMSSMTAFLFAVAGCALLVLSPVHRRRNLFSFWLAVIVVLAAMILVVGYLVNAPLFYGTTTIPPAMTTSLAFLLLGSALALSSGLSARLSRQYWDDDAGRGMTAILLLVFILLATGILGAGYLYSRHQQRQFHSRVEIELSAIADLKTGQIGQWRRERLGDATIFYKNYAFSETVRRFLDNTGDGEARQDVRMWLEKINSLPQYYRVSLFDAAGTEQLVAPVGAGKASSAGRRDIAGALASHQITFNDFHRENPSLPPHLEIVVPILAAPDWDSILGVLTLGIDPGQDLYPLIQSWPMPSESAETLLVRREGDAVLFLNNLRFQENAALDLRLPLTREDLPAVMAVRGETGVVEGIDYRGKAVIAALRAIPDTPWFMVARMDQDEINRPLREQLFGITGLLCIFLLGAGAIVGLIWRNQRARYYRLRYEAAQEVAESARRLQSIFESAKDGILAADSETRKFVSANTAICRMLGYNRDELLTMRMNDIHPEENLPDIVEKFE